MSSSEGIIRKVAIGPDYRNCMQYVVGGKIGEGEIHSIRQTGGEEFCIYLLMEGKVKLWKKLQNQTIHVEYDLDFNDSAI